MRVLLIEDDLILGQEVKIALENAGFFVDLATDAWSGESAALAERYGVILLDLNLPDREGLDTLKMLRQRGSHVPIIVVTANDNRETVLSSLDTGADDYVKKPFDIDELIARIKAATRRSEGRSSNRLRAGLIEVDRDAGSAWVNGSAVALTAKELAVLSLLVRKAGTFVSREQIESELYDDSTTVQSNTVETTIYNLRRKLGASSVMTTRGLGYVVAR
jgi:two-component system, OmpR family, response regulator